MTFFPSNVNIII